MSPTSLIKVDDVKSTGLSFFKPTTNPYTQGSGNYTVTAPIDEASMWNGRQVFYLPQFTACTYNVMLGDAITGYDGAVYVKTTANDAGPVTFTPNTDGGYTSWLRGLFTIQDPAKKPVEP